MCGLCLGQVPYLHYLTVCVLTQVLFAVIRYTPLYLLRSELSVIERLRTYGQEMLLLKRPGITAGSFENPSRILRLLADETS